jgi:hypothetical protein
MTRCSSEIDPRFSGSVTELVHQIETGMRMTAESVQSLCSGRVPGRTFPKTRAARAADRSRRLAAFGVFNCSVDTVDAQFDQTIENVEQRRDALLVTCLCQTSDD